MNPIGAIEFARFLESVCLLAALGLAILVLFEVVWTHLVKGDKDHDSTNSQ